MSLAPGEPPPLFFGEPDRDSRSFSRSSERSERSRDLDLDLSFDLDRERESRFIDTDLDRERESRIARFGDGDRDLDTSLSRDLLARGRNREQMLENATLSTLTWSGSETWTASSSLPTWTWTGPATWSDFAQILTDFGNENDDVNGNGSGCSMNETANGDYDLHLDHFYGLRQVGCGDH